MPLRGGSYNNNDNAGLAALNLNNERNNSNNNVGFRPALACSRIWKSPRATISARQKERYSCVEMAQTGNRQPAAASNQNSERGCRDIKGKSNAENSQ